MPVPTAEVRENIATVRRQWLRLEDSFFAVADRPVDDSEAIKAEQVIKTEMPAFSQASRNVTAAAGIRLFNVRQLVLRILVAIAAFSLVLFVAGLLVTRRFIAHPVQRLQLASHRIGAGDFDYRVPVAQGASDDELVALGKTFNKMADEIRRALDRYRDLFENANDFVYTADLNGAFYCE